MPEHSEASSDAFLSMVVRQLKGLGQRERQEISQELAGHIEDARSRWEEQGLSPVMALANAVTEMGDPVEVGTQLRDEHLARGLSLREALLAGAPCLTLALPYLSLMAFSILLPLNPYAQGMGVAVAVAAMAIPLALGLLGLRQGHRLWLATFAGYLALALFFLGTHLPGRQSGAADAEFVLVMLLLPAVGLWLRSGSLAGACAVLGGMGFWNFLHWAEGPFVWYKVLALLAPFLGLVVLGLTPRRWQPLAAWGALCADFALAPLSSVYWWQHLPSWAHPPEGGLTIDILVRELPIEIFFIGALAMLLAQVLAGDGIGGPGRREVSMRGGTMILSSVLALGLAFQSWTAGPAGPWVDYRGFSERFSIGVIVVLLYLIGAAFATRKPAVSAVVFAAAAVYALGCVQANYGDFAVWAAAALVLMGTSFLGERERRSQLAEGS
ncbi:MAG: permease prefix domain 1-containing protein [Dehalococcoidia bacterium]|nr:permease prefix domain 1-containing protein [Dehalococcoidia bacterium]